MDVRPRRGAIEKEIHSKLVLLALEDGLPHVVKSPSGIPGTALHDPRSYGPVVAARPAGERPDVPFRHPLCDLVRLHRLPGFALRHSVYPVNRRELLFREVIAHPAIDV